MNLSVLSRLALPAVLAARSQMTDRLATIAGEISEAATKLAEDQARRDRRQADLGEANTELQTALAAVQTADEQFQSGAVLRGAFTAAQERRDRVKRKVSRLTEEVGTSARKVEEWQGKLKRLRAEQAGIEALLGLYAVLVAKKEADLAWQDARVKLMNSPGAEAIFAEEMGIDAAAAYELAEQINRLQADRAHRVDKLRRFVMAAPEGFYRTEHDLYPARVLLNGSDRYLVYCQASPRYFYNRMQVAELLGRDPDGFAPEYTRIDRREFELAVRHQRVLKNDGTPVAMEEVVPLRQMEFSTSQVNVRKLGPTEDAKLLMYHPEVGNTPLSQVDDPEVAAVVEELNNLRDAQDGNFDDPEKPNGPTARLRHLAGIPRKVLTRAVGPDRAQRFLGKLFGRPLE